jgi:hypothetical protein
LPKLVVVFLDRSSRSYVLDLPSLGRNVRSGPCPQGGSYGTSIFHCQQNLKLYRSLVAASEAAAAKADTRQKKQLKLLAKEVPNEPPARKN